MATEDREYECPVCGVEVPVSEIKECAACGELICPECAVLVNGRTPYCEPCAESRDVGKGNHD